MNLTDQINFINTAHASQTVFKIISAIQGENPGSQVTAAGMLFLLLCKKYKADPRETLSKADRVLYNAFSEGRGEYIRAVQMYIEKEL